MKQFDEQLQACLDDDGKTRTSSMFNLGKLRVRDVAEARVMYEILRCACGNDYFHGIPRNFRSCLDCMPPFMMIAFYALLNPQFNWMSDDIRLGCACTTWMFSNRMEMLRHLDSWCSPSTLEQIEGRFFSCVDRLHQMAKLMEGAELSDKGDSDVARR